MTAISQQIRNGVDSAQMYGTLDAIKADPSLGRFQFRVANEWQGGAHNRSTIQRFYGAGQEDTSRQEPFTLDAGEPAVLLGHDEGANPAEALLHALAGCLTTSLVYVAAARKVPLTRVESRLEGDAPEEKLREVLERAQARSAVFDMVNHGVPTTVELAR